NPIPTKGFTKIKFLTNEFVTLTNKLSYYLKPTEELLKNEEYKRINTILTAKVAFSALAVIANHESRYKGVPKSTPEGVVKIYIENEDLEIFLHCHDKKFEIIPSYSKEPRAFMKFKDIDTANEILNGKLDSYSAIALERLELSGHMGMIDNVNKVLFVVPAYLK
ncbi:SCP2 sterol-binding domain-containing protein, partial [Romboutsia sp.]|uniref:SCP2 sterol-binding domain-containing protein n=1 Tax=Romboutsia sp. TaxID=1965302 RepID=UPI003F3565CF